MTTSDTRPDFIWRLASRATDDTAAIEPRLPSLFEKVSGEPIGRQTSITDEDPATVVTSQPQAAPGMSPGRATDTRINLQEQHEARVDVAQGLLRPEFSIDREINSAVKGPADPDPVAFVHRNTPVEAPTDFVSSRTSTIPAETTNLDAHYPQSAPARKIRTDEPGVLRPASPPSDEKTHAAAPQWPTLELPDDDVAGHAVKREDFRSPHHHDQFLLSREHAPLAAPPSASRWRPQVPPAEVPNPPAPEPVVNITIGRLEVRAAVATTPPAATPKRTTAPLGLDDYLQGRTRSK